MSIDLTLTIDHTIFITHENKKCFTLFPSIKKIPPYPELAIVEKVSEKRFFLKKGIFLLGKIAKNVWTPMASEPKARE